MSQSQIQNNNGRCDFLKGTALATGALAHCKAGVLKNQLIKKQIYHFGKKKMQLIWHFLIRQKDLFSIPVWA